ncbi:TPA: 2OG-Fe(II) oxygenase family protein [Legionella pneumophila]|uniref:2OG-Fe(II) oxygenase family protein n=1 Tax=Legionella pneumophila TaxID=446 RepID=UPI00047FBCF3|nr:2OG-Fe(II) oxygenase family protein [Legionella pneumophila]ANH12815.1 iron/ascorbate oxidoreductase [Legionella pneumophila]ANH15782.1 iron/ascorbate oxidoreductase [Legionella pneumophila]ANH18748.1 iron/ascorbate oxidoreductase [Legionella pneumophila]APX19635.1 iron/ascorbate oxidoreductase [Legionella pneumophila]AQL11812.1 iron/ascorbate oxidoreductase [Legionella pneumophila]
MKNKNKSVITVDLNDPVKSLEYLEEAFQIGTFILKNSPVNFKRLAKVLSDLDTFYNLDFKTKIEISGQISGGGATRGYFPLGIESGLVDVFEKKESYSFGWPDNEIPDSDTPNLSLVAPNIYPEHGYINQDDVGGLIKDFANTAKELSKLIEIILFNGKAALPIDESSDFQSLLRSFRYYKKTELDPPNTGANSLHTDWNLITLVYADADGYQYRDNEGNFQNIIPETDDCLIVNFGDFLSAWTGGKIVSPWHQVVEAKKKDVRNSLVFFYYPAASSSAVKNPIYNQGEPLSLFVDQSDPLNRLWDFSKIETMNEMYAEKWKQVSRK